MEVRRDNDVGRSCTLLAAVLRDKIDVNASGVVVRMSGLSLTLA